MLQHFHDRPRRVLRGLLLAVGLAALTACDRFPIEIRAAQSVAQERIEYRPGEAAIYCYRSIADPDCYAEPQPGPPNRLIQGYNTRVNP